LTIESLPSSTVLISQEIEKKVGNGKEQEQNVST
jgi:hypothetical protein